MNRLITPKKLSNREFVIPVLMFAIPLLVDRAASRPEAVGRKPGGYPIKSWLRRVEKRVVDLLLPFRGFWYYHPAQQGSASMKAVLPALTGQGYGDLAIQEGNTASLEFLRVTYGDVPEEERQRVRRQLEDYCGRDTGGMVQIVGGLKDGVAG